MSPIEPSPDSIQLISDRLLLDGPKVQQEGLDSSKSSKETQMKQKEKKAF